MCLKGACVIRYGHFKGTTVYYDNFYTTFYVQPLRSTTRKSNIVTARAATVIKREQRNYEDKIVIPCRYERSSVSHILKLSERRDCGLHELSKNYNTERNLLTTRSGVFSFFNFYCMSLLFSDFVSAWIDLRDYKIEWSYYFLGKTINH